MIVFGIESTCDETAAAIVENGHRILSQSIASSVDIHQRYGGVFPELACRRHIDAILPVVEETLKQANITPDQIDLIAVAKGPGLVGALIIGMQIAKGLSIAWKKPFIGVNHVEAHLYAAMMGVSEPLFPALGLVVSGGHTLLLKIEGIGAYQSIGGTVDDAAGEAFDKVATLLGLPYPGGPPIEKIALRGNPLRYPFKAGRVKRNPLDFSFSGIKTNVLYTVRDKTLSEEEKADVAASFQEAVCVDIANKTALALKHFPSRAIYLGGGVCNNQRLRALFSERFSTLPVFWSPHDLSSDNAVMIAGLGFQKFLSQGAGDPLDLEVSPRISFT